MKSSSSTTLACWFEKSKQTIRIHDRFLSLLLCVHRVAPSLLILVISLVCVQAKTVAIEQLAAQVAELKPAADSVIVLKQIVLSQQQALQAMITEVDALKQKLKQLETGTPNSLLD